MSATGDCVSWQCEVCAAVWFTLVIWGTHLFHLCTEMIPVWPTQSPPNPPKAVNCVFGVSWVLWCAQAGSSCPAQLHLNTAELLSPGWANRPWGLIPSPEPTLLCDNIYVAKLFLQPGWSFTNLLLTRLRFDQCFLKNMAWHPQQMTTGWINKKDVIRWFLT